LLSGDTRDKLQRAEKNIGLTKWVFEAPRKDLTEFLQDQCVSNLSSELISLLFSDDHYKEKYFLQGLAMLDDALSSEKFCLDNFAIELVALRPRYIANADLILKYLTIRLADTNTTMIIKCLDLIEHLFAAMDDEGYTMSEYEASVFLPYFINKVN
jgi:cytoskeleton-associated protein 5